MNEIEQQIGSVNNDEVSLKYFIVTIKQWYHYVLSKSTIILVVAIIGACIGFMYAYIKKPIYNAELSFALQDDKSGNLSGALGLASQFGLDLGGVGSGGEFSGDNLIVLMKSRNVLSKVLLTAVPIDGKQQTLAELYISFNKLRDKWKNKPGLESIHFLPNADPRTFTLKQDSLLGVFRDDILKENLTVDKLDKKLSIIAIDVSSTNELFSKDFAEILANVVSDFYIQTKTKKAAKNVAILQHQTDSVRQTLNAAISSMASSSDATPNPNPSFQILHVPSQRKQVEIQANTAILGELVKNLEISKMSLMQSTPLIQIIDKPILPLEKHKLSKLIELIIGGFLGGFIAVIILLLRKIVKTITADIA